jgi:hypothetical protein
VGTLTRSQVARRLGKSIATVRRLEGRVLFPRFDSRGTHWFDEWEVERIRLNPEQISKHGRSKWFRTVSEQSRLRTRDEAWLTQPTVSPNAHALPRNRRASFADALEALLAQLLEVDTRRLVAAGLDEHVLAVLLGSIDELQRPS